MTKSGKIIFVLFCLFLIILSGLFFVYYHKDTLKNYVPAEVSLYIHTYPHEINRLFVENYDLEQVVLGLFDDQAQIKKLLILTDKEIAIIKPVNQDYRILTFQTPALVDELNKDKIPYKICDSVIVFPETNNFCDQPKLIYQPKRLNFAKATIYFTGKEPLFLPNFIDRSYVTPFYAYLSRPKFFKNTKLYLETTLAGELMSKNTAKKQFSVNSSQKPRFELYNVDLSKLTLKASIIPENFKYQLLQNFSQINYFADFDDKFVLVVGGLSLKDTQTVIKKRLAFLMPQERKKVLPDDTIAINLIANPAYWDFAYDNGAWQIEEPRQNIKIQMKQIENAVLITNNLDINLVNYKDFSSDNYCAQAPSEFIYHYNSLTVQVANDNKIELCLN